MPGRHYINNDKNNFKQGTTFQQPYPYISSSNRPGLQIGAPRVKERGQRELPTVTCVEWDGYPEPSIFHSPRWLEQACYYRADSLSFTEHKGELHSRVLGKLLVKPGAECLDVEVLSHLPHGKWFQENTSCLQSGLELQCKQDLLQRNSTVVKTTHRTRQNFTTLKMLLRVAFGDTGFKPQL